MGNTKIQVVYIFVRVFLIFSFLYFASLTWAIEPEIITDYHYTQDNDSLKDVLENKIGFDKEILYGPHGLFEKIKKWNPSIINWDSMKEGTEIYIEYPFGTVLRPKSSEPIVEAPKEEEKEIEEEIIAPAPKPKKKEKKNFTLFSFFTASKGTFTESLTVNEEVAEVTSSQNSPISFGIGTAYFYKPQHTYSGSIYFSSLTGSVAEDTAQEIDIPAEIGTNIYYNYSFLGSGFSIYSGLDHEMFSTFNTDDIIGGSNTYKAKEHNITFLTAGFGKSFTIKNKRLLFKASLSKSVRSGSSEAPTLTNNGDNTYSGIKYILYLNYKTSSNFLVHTIFKQHLLDGPTDLSILRIGFGVGYKFF